MKIPGMTTEIQNLMNLWCQWCVNANKLIPFEEWVRYTHEGEELKAILAVFNPTPLPPGDTGDDFLVRIRLRGTDKYIGQKDPTYALVADGERVLITDAHWFVPRNRAKTWPNVSSLRKFCGMATGGKWSEATFSRYEAVLADGTTKSLEDVLR